MSNEIINVKMLRELQKLFESMVLSLLCVDLRRGMACFLSHAGEGISQAITYKYGRRFSDLMYPKARSYLLLCIFCVVQPSHPCLVVPGRLAVFSLSPLVDMSGWFCFAAP